MKPKAVALAAFCFSLSTLGVGAVTPGDEYALTPRQIHALAQQATSGDRQATFRLVQFYLLYDPDLPKAIHWQRVAAKQGDVRQMINLASSLSIAGGKTNCLEAEQWLLQATSAKSSHAAARATRELELLRSAESKCTQWLSQRATSNNSFKPKPLRGSA
jgi:TPR repeat protein